jgi:MoxR-like ATPase
VRSFRDPDDVQSALEAVSYLADEEIATTLFLAHKLGKPLLLEGPAGTGKTQLAVSAAEALGARLIRLQCYEGLDEGKVLYEWNYRRQLLRIQVEKQEQSDDGAGDGVWGSMVSSIFSEEFLLARPLLEAIRSPDPVVLLIDEVDRVEMETEALLLEVLSEYQVSIPELGTVRAAQIPLVILTSNGTRDLSEALKRRCLYLFLDYPTRDRERAIVLQKVDGVDERLAMEVVRVVALLRTLELQKVPSVSETLDWARTLLLLGIDHADVVGTRRTLNTLLKYQSDLELVRSELDTLLG